MPIWVPPTKKTQNNRNTDKQHYGISQKTNKQKTSTTQGNK